MVTQVLGVTLLMLAIRWPAIQWWGLLVMWGVVVFAVWSAVDYFRRFWGKVDSSIKLRRRRELLTLERRKRRLERAQRDKSGSNAAPSTQ
jgi:CDP-diacylglycerol--glycerol-3-phosphate 3-phosphatidyltransferase